MLLAVEGSQVGVENNARDQQLDFCRDTKYDFFVGFTSFIVAVGGAQLGGAKNARDQQLDFSRGKKPAATRSRGETPSNP